ncbi:MAG: phenylpyruvate tautomerase MIF-related protein [Desulfovibrionaceae bacterium]
MPFAHLQTNARLTPEREADILAGLSALVAELTGKPERYVMVSCRGMAMRFGGSDEPLARLRVESIGLDSAWCAPWCARLCDFIHAELGIPGDRVYVTFHDLDAAFVGWDGGTFG